MELNTKNLSSLASLSLIQELWMPYGIRSMINIHVEEVHLKGYTCWLTPYVFGVDMEFKTYRVINNFSKIIY